MAKNIWKFRVQIIKFYKFKVKSRVNESSLKKISESRKKFFMPKKKLKSNRVSESKPDQISQTGRPKNFKVHKNVEKFQSPENCRKFYKLK